MPGRAGGWQQRIRRRRRRDAGVSARHGNGGSLLVPGPLCGGIRPDPGRPAEGVAGRFGGNMTAGTIPFCKKVWETLGGFGKTSCIFYGTVL